MGRRLGSVAAGAASCRGSASRRAVCTLAILGAGRDTRKSFEVSSYRLSDSGISLQIRPKASEKTRRMQNLPRNRIGNELPFLANPTLELSHDLRVTILRTILSVNSNLRTNGDLRSGFWMVRVPIPDPVFLLAGGRDLIPKDAFGWPTLAGLFFARVGSFSCPFSNFCFLVGCGTFL